MLRADVIIPLLSPSLTVKINGEVARMSVARQQQGAAYNLCEFVVDDAEPGPVRSITVDFHHPRASLRGVWGGGTF